MQTIQQQRAKQALLKVRSYLTQKEETAGQQAAEEQNPKPLSQKELKEYRTHTQSLPFMIYANGLGQAYSFYLANCGDAKKPKPSYEAICDTLAEWLLAEGQPYAKKGLGHDKADNRNRLLEAITGEEMDVYLLAQAEAIAYMAWVKRFAEAFIHSEDKQEKIHG